MKRKYFFLLFLLTLILPGTGHAQDEILAVDSLIIELWPDYDRASVLVLLTGTLSVNTKLPASVTLPFPEKAMLNAVARIDGSDGVMKNDIIYTMAPDGITFTIPDLRFRLEYYLPYSVNNDQRTFNFTWLTDAVCIGEFQLRVQQPTSSSSLTTEPATMDIFKGQDGFTYYAFPVQSVPDGQSFSVQVDYTMTSAQLSVASSVPPGVQETALPSTLKADTGVNWIIVAVVLSGIILVTVLVWHTATRRSASNGSISHHKKSHSKFCTNCGNPTGKDDRFCGKCGSALQGE
jgi:zinc-ribbon domain